VLEQRGGKGETQSAAGASAHSQSRVASDRRAWGTPDRPKKARCASGVQAWNLGDRGSVVGNRILLLITYYSMVLWFLFGFCMVFVFLGSGYSPSL